jgi:hypothetical protein
MWGRRHAGSSHFKQPIGNARARGRLYSTLLNNRVLVPIIGWCRSSTVTLEKSGLKRDGPVFFSSAPVKVAGDE